MAKCDPALARLALPGGRPAGRWRWLLALGISAALHGGLLAMKAGGQRPATVSLPLPLRVQLAPGGGAEPAALRETSAAPRLAPAGQRAPGIQRERAAAEVLPVREGVPARGQEAGPRIDTEAARALARSSYGSPAGKEGGGIVAESAPALADRPVLPVLAQRMGPPAAVVSETMVGGSRLIRFRDGRCLQIPVDAPSWRESRVVPTEWTTTNCPP